MLKIFFNLTPPDLFIYHLPIAIPALYDTLNRIKNVPFVSILFYIYNLLPSFHNCGPVDPLLHNKELRLRFYLWTWEEVLLVYVRIKS